MCPGIDLPKNDSRVCQLAYLLHSFMHEFTVCAMFHITVSWLGLSLSVNEGLVIQYFIIII